MTTTVIAFTKSVIEFYVEKTGTKLEKYYLKKGI